MAAGISERDGLVRVWVGGDLRFCLFLGNLERAHYASQIIIIISQTHTGWPSAFVISRCIHIYMSLLALFNEFIIHPWLLTIFLLCKGQSMGMFFPQMCWYYALRDISWSSKILLHSNYFPLEGHTDHKSKQQRKQEGNSGPEGKYHQRFMRCLSLPG